MKLTTAQIQNIDEYLQRSGVTYWDVRIEVLDHFIIAIEEKLSTTQLSFDEALMEVTVAFGNSIQERHLLNKDKTAVLFTGIFSNNKGFKELAAEKRTQTRKQYMRHIWKQIQENFLNTNFYFIYLCLIIVSYVSFIYITNWTLLVMGAWFCVEIFKTLYATKKYKFAQDSMYGEMSTKSISVVFGLSINLCMLVTVNNGVKPKHIFWFAIVYLVAYPVLKAILAIHKNIYKQYQKYHKLISA